jgi:plastocyanin
VRRTGLGISIVATLALAGVATASDRTAGAPEQRKTVNVTVADDYYAPTSVKIKKGSKVKWVWDDFNFNTHDVSLTNEKPDGVKKGDFKSRSAAINQTFKKKFEVPGKYGFQCTFHKTVMTMTVKVKK